MYTIRYSSHIFNELEFSEHIFDKSTKYHVSLSSGSRVVPCEQTDRQTDRQTWWSWQSLCATSRKCLEKTERGRTFNRGLRTAVLLEIRELQTPAVRTTDYSDSRERFYPYQYGRVSYLLYSKVEATLVNPRQYITCLSSYNQYFFVGIRIFSADKSAGAINWLITSFQCRG
jgi:hypothetical protein